jgi:hypothetical protein
MIEALILIAVGLATTPAFMSTRRRVWISVVSYVSCCPVLMFAFLEAVKDSPSSSYGESLGSAVGAVVGGASSLVVCAISAGIGLFRTRKLVPDKGQTDSVPTHARNPKTRRRSRRRGEA